MRRQINLEDEQKTGFLLFGIVQIVIIVLMLILRLDNMTIIPKVSIATIIDPIIGNIIICIGAFYGYFLIASDNLNKALGSIIISILSIIVGITSSYFAIVIGILLLRNSIQYRKYLDTQASMPNEMEICVKCSNCGKDNPTNVIYCMECGSVLLGKEGNVKAQSKKKNIAINIISVIICLLSIAYICWYAIMSLAIKMEDISNDNCISFSVLPILIISIFMLIFFILKSPNVFVILPILAICCVIIALIVPLVIWIFNEALVFLCSLGGLASIAGTLKPFIFVIWK